MKPTLAFSIALIFVFITVSGYAQNSNLLDRRALSTYSSDDVNQMPLAKIKQLNFYYRESFIVPGEMKSLVNPDDINIKIYEDYRQLKERTKVNLFRTDIPKSENMPTSANYIILLSKQEVSDAFLEIEKSNPGSK